MDFPGGKKRFFDTGSYLTTPTFKGVYDGIKEHEPDLQNVLSRAWRRGVDRIIVPGININVSREALEIASSDDRMFCTVGCSPARSHEFDKEGAEDYVTALTQIIDTNRSKIVAYGEIGLDYRWLEICDKDTQTKYFEMQLDLAKSFKMPVYVNARNSIPDVISLLKKHNSQLFGGTIHSFDGTQDEAQAIMDLGFYIGINGCSLRTDENLATVKSIPLERILLETNSPWCLLKPLHAGYRFVKTTFPARAKFHWSADAMVRGRNEPANINQIVEVLSAVKGIDPDQVSDVTFQNGMDLFFPSSKPEE